MASGQEITDYRYYKLFEDTVDVEPLKDEAADSVVVLPKYRKLRRSLFEGISAVANDRRGTPYYNERDIFRGVSLPKTIRGRGYRLGLETEQLSGTTDNIYTSAPFRDQTDVGFSLSTRAYMGGVMATVAHNFSKLSIAADISAKAGSDSHIKGVYTNQLSLSALMSYKVDSLRSLTLIFSISPTEKSQRGASASEAFTLISDNFYNPTWGYQAGKVRSANIRKSLLPTAVLSYDGAISPKTKLTTTLGVTAGSSSYTALDWLNTLNPQPDYYLNMPSYAKDSHIATQIAQNWVENNSRFTQIDFDELYRINSMLPEAIYVMGEQVVRSLNLEFCAVLSSSLSSKSTLIYGVDAQYNRNCNFKRMADLLGGGAIENIDYFLVEDDNYINALRNDIRSGDKRIEVGDKYSYHYAMTNWAASIFGLWRGKFTNLDIEVGAKISAAQVQRRGYFQKELYSGNSYGKSAALNFAPLKLHAAMAYRRGVHTLSAAAAFSKELPEVENLFIQPLYNNRNIVSPALSNRLRATVGYQASWSALWLRANIFANYCSNQVSTLQMYDDIAVEYVDVVARGISTIAAGVEVEAEAEVARHLRLSAAVSAGQYAYLTDPKLTIYVDSSNEVVATDVISHISGLSTGRTPAIRALGKVSYYNRGWSVSLGAEYNALRYVVPSLVRRTDRVAERCASAEQFENMIAQQRLPDAFTMDFMLSKRVYLERFSKRIYRTNVAPRFIDRNPRANISFMIAIDNLLGSRDIIYRGYETTRLFKDYSGSNNYTVRAHPSRYLYAYPRTIYFQAKFSF